MPDMTPVLLAKSDQINGPDLIGGPRVVQIAGVRLTGKDQAVDIAVEGDDKLWRPCKTVVRLLARAWGNEGNNWVGKSAQLFYDADVRYGKDKPGGVRVSHLSHLSGELTVCLQVRKGVVKEYTIKPLATKRQDTPAASLPDAAAVTPSTDAGQSTGAATDKKRATAAQYADWYINGINGCDTLEQIDAAREAEAEPLQRMRAAYPDLGDKVDAVVSAKTAFLKGLDDAPGGVTYGEQGDEA